LWLAYDSVCTGLGDVTPRAIAGSPAPPSPLSQVIDPVTLTIGDKNVPVSLPVRPRDSPGSIK